MEWKPTDDEWKYCALFSSFNKSQHFLLVMKGWIPFTLSVYFVFNIFHLISRSACMSTICSRVAIKHELDALFSEDLRRTTTVIWLLWWVAGCVMCLWVDIWLFGCLVKKHYTSWTKQHTSGSPTCRGFVIVFILSKFASHSNFMFISDVLFQVHLLLRIYFHCVAADPELWSRWVSGLFVTERLFGFTWVDKWD